MIDETFFWVNLHRANLWHGEGIHEWSIMEWAGAMAFEAGEAGNVAKKMRRIELGRVGNQEADQDYDKLRADLITELADTFTYMCLLLARVDSHPEEFDAAVRAKFNKVSEANGFGERV